MHPRNTRTRSLHPVVLTCLYLTCLAVLPLTAQEFAINQLTSGTQANPDLATLPDGGFIVVWQSPTTAGDDNNDLAIVGRYLDSSGTPTSGDFQINTYTTWSQRRPRVAIRPDGSFVVAWVHTEMANQEVFDHLRARTFDSSGSGSPDDFLVDVFHMIESHDVGAAASGQFVIAHSRRFRELGEPVGYGLIRRFQPDGTEIDSAALTGSGIQTVPVRIDGNEDQGFVVGAATRPLYGGIGAIEATRLDADGAILGDAIDLYGDQTPILAVPNGADVALEPSGAFVVAWDGQYYPDLEKEVYARRVDDADVLNPAGPQQINTYTTGWVSAPSIARGGDGSFLMVWEAQDPPADSFNGIRGRRLDSSGTPIGDAFAVNMETQGSQRTPEVAASADGSQFLVVWSSASGIRGRFFGLERVFQDGFESGEVNAWSSSSP